MEHLNEGNTYSQINRDPTQLINGQLFRLLDKQVNSGLIPKSLVSKAKCHQPQYPQLYGLVKIHKEDHPIRPIVAFLNTPLTNLSNILAEIIKPLNNDSSHRLKNTYDFVQSFKNHKEQFNPEKNILCSYDVKSLYTKVPMNKALDIIMDHIIDDPGHLDSYQICPEAFRDLIKFCIDSCYFEYNNSFYRQGEGGPMGSSLTVELSEIFMQHFEKNAILYSPVEVPFWKRFVDDGLANLQDENEIYSFLNYINSIDPAIQFTVELPTNEGLPYLDAFIHRDNSISIYRKPTHTDKYLNYASCHPNSVKKGVVISLVDRALKICDPPHLEKELQHISMALSNNGYPKSIIESIIKERKIKINSNSTQVVDNNYKDTYKNWVTLDFVPKVSYKLKAILNKQGIGVRFSSGNTLKSILCKLKSPLPFGLNKNAIYKISCNDTCNKPYIGLTIQHIKSRITQHMRDLNPNIELENIKHSTAYHQRVSGHFLEWDDVEVLDKENKPWLLPYKESIAICKFNAGPPNGLNRDWGYRMPHIWKALYNNVTYNAKKNQSQ